MATELGLDELRAHALTTIGMVKNDLDFGSGTADMERALEIALAADSPVAATTVNNLAVYATFAGDFPRTDELYAEAMRLAERFGDASHDAVRTRQSHLDRLHARALGCGARVGECDSSRECEAGSPHTLEPFVREVRAAILIARGDPDAALRDQLIALERDETRGTSRFTGSERSRAPPRSMWSSVGSTRHASWP